MSDTPRTDAATKDAWTRFHWEDFARQLERELNEAQRQARLYNADTMKVMEQRDQWKALAQELFALLEGNHDSSCSIHSPEEPHCDCGYQQGFDAVLSRFNELNQPQTHIKSFPKPQTTSKEKLQQ